MNDDVPPFVSIKWHKKNPLGCVVWFIAQLMAHATNIYTAATYLVVILLSLLGYCRE